MLWVQVYSHPGHKERAQEGGELGPWAYTQQWYLRATPTHTCTASDCTSMACSPGWKARLGPMVRCPPWYSQCLVSREPSWTPGGRPKRQGSPGMPRGPRHLGNCNEPLLVTGDGCEMLRKQSEGPYECSLWVNDNHTAYSQPRGHPVANHGNLARVPEVL